MEVLSMYKVMQRVSEFEEVYVRKRKRKKQS